MPAPAKKDTVLETIFKWSGNRPEWQRDALRRIIANGSPDENDLAEILNLCKKEHGDDTVAAIAAPLTMTHLPVDPGVGEAITIASLSDVVGVNQLAVDQTLKFETTGLTVIYGPNGTGKSGYSRILKKACRARHAGEIMPDIYNPPPTGNATASLSIVKGNAAAQPIAWEDDGSSPDLLSAITVFDRDCASVHVQKKNEVWFRPFGLDIPDDLAGVCQHLKDKLTAEKSALLLQKNPVFDTPTWSDRSTIGKVMGALKANTDLEPITPKVDFSKEQEARLVKLRADLTQDGSVAAGVQLNHAIRLDQLVAYIRLIEESCSDAALAKLYNLKAEAISTRAVAEAAATTAFSGLAIEGVGGTVWKNLWESAKRYSEIIGDEGIKFPPAEGDTCVVCHQSIDSATATRMMGFEDFIQKDTEAEATAAESRLKEATDALADLVVHVNKVSVARQYLMLNDNDISRNALRFLAMARLRQRQALRQIEKDETANLTPLPAAPTTDIEAVASASRIYAASLVEDAGNDEREKLLDELAELEDLKQSDNLITIAKAEIDRLVQEKRLNACIKDTSTTAITKLGNTIADEMITPLMRDRFRQEIGELAGSRVRVEIVRSGGKFGSPQYEVRLYANPKTKVHDVLSEGEQTCVALASYLTELANASHTSALVFDDPVTSLDHKWRGKVAKRLVKESNVRQIVVFTHDLIFVNDLHQIALSQNIPVELANLTRGETGVGIVNENLPWRASGVKQRIDKLEKETRNAKKLYEANEDERYRHEAHGIYNRLRAAWERGLEEIVFAGVILRHRDYINTNGLGRVTALEKADVDAFDLGFKKCCDYVDAHDASRGRDSAPPDPDEIMADIKALQTWSENLRTKMNAIG